MNCKLLFTFVVCLLPCAALTADQEDSLVAKFIRTLPYRASYLSLPQSKQSQAGRVQFGGLRWADCPEGSTVDSCYTVFGYGLQTRKHTYLFAWSVAAESLSQPRLITPAEDTLTLQWTTKPMAPNSRFTLPTYRAIDIYATKLDHYLSLQRQVKSLNWEAAGEATLMAAAWYGTSLLLKSHKSDTRGLGYAAAGLLSIGLIFDIREYISRNRCRSEAKALGQELESWDDLRTRNIIDSLARELPESSQSNRSNGAK